MKCTRSVGFLLLLVAAASEAFAGNHDISVWTKWNSGEETTIPWYLYNSKKVSVDTRYNFDEPKTWAGFLGHTFGTETFSVSPYVGFLAGDTKGSSAQLNVSFSHGKSTIFVLNQYAWMSGKTPDFLYHWGDTAYLITTHLAVGFDEQIYREPRSESFVDLGPVLKILPTKKIYAKLWLTSDPGHSWHKKFFAGVGYVP